MKRILQIFAILIGLIGIANAQGSSYINYERDGGWNIGFNMGATWQPREAYNGTTLMTKPYGGFGGGMTLGKSIYEKQGAFFAVDLRGRYLVSYNAGWSGVPEHSYELTGDTTGASFGFRNYRMNLHEFSFEGVLTLNKLRERTGIILYGFGGIGATLNKVDADYRDFTGDYYNYSVGQFGINTIDTSMNDQAIAAELQGMSDHNFETPLSPLRFSLVPSWGVGFGYQIGPSFSMGVEYKLAYDILGDEFDGGASNMLKDNVMDKYHYANVFFRWNLLKPGATYTVNNNNQVDPWTTNTNTNTTTTTTTVTTTQNKPLVNIYNPGNNNIVVHSSAYTIKAKIYHVETTSGVTFKQNGLINNTFTFNPSTNEFIAQVYLLPGSNSFEITGTNTYGSDQDSRIIIFEQETFTQLPPPIVTFTNPAQSGTTVNQSQYTIVANVLNVSSKNDINFNFNGQNVTNFTYNSSSKVVTAVVTLLEGNNTVTIKGTNTVGSDVETTSIKYVKPQTIQPPVVTITTPGSNPFTSNSPVEFIEGNVLHVNSAADIQVLVNGNNINNFNYSSLTKKVSFSANMIIGANVIQITGTNQYGVDAASTTIIYKPTEVMPLPIVDFIVPSASPYTSNTNNLTLKATVLNVGSYNNIKVTANGINYPAFTFNTVTKEVAFNVNLVTGNNIFTVTGTNSAGSDMDEQVIVYTKVEQQQPPIVNITNPTSNPYNTNVGTQIINAEILNVTSASGVTAKFNGQSITNFTFDPISHKFVYAAGLQVGANVLEVTGTNNVGTASKSQTIIYTVPVTVCDKPVINLTQPTVETKNAGGVSGNALVINTNNSKGSILGNITGATSIDFKINGVSTPGYNYNPNSGSFDSYLHLNEGANNYELIATNSCGSTIVTITYIYTPEQAPCNNPVINWVYPGTSPFSYTGPASVSLSASVLGVQNIGNLSIKVNNMIVKGVYDPSTGTVSFGANMKTGSNTIYLKATNECGSSESTITINYTQPVNPPTVNITNPAQDPFNTFNGVMTSVAGVTNIDDKSQIQVFLDGQLNKNFTFNSNSKTVEVSLNLAIGSHHLKVQATNTAGTAFDEVEINVQQQCQTPVILVTQPAGATSGNFSLSTSNSKGSILANISNASSIVFKVNGEVSNGYNYNPSTGSFESLWHLNAGLNKYELTAINACGTQTTQVLNVTYTPTQVPCNEPTISYLSPSTNPYTSSSAKGVMVRATVNNVSSANQVVCTVNGTVVAHTYSSGSISFSTNLYEGNNPVSITATNSCGSISSDIVIVYDKPIPAPEVEITTPSQNPYNTSSSNVLLTATIFNVSGQSAVQLLVDGQSISSFTYDYTTKVLTSNLSLTNGTHNVVVKGTNSAGTAQDATTIIVSIPVTPPDVSITNITGSSSSNPFIAPSCTGFNVTGVVSNANANQVSYKVDGLNATGVKTIALSSTMFQYNFPVTFVQPGQVVTVTVTASNSDGSDSQTEYVKCTATTTTTPDGGNTGTTGGSTGGVTGGGNNTFTTGGGDDDDNGGSGGNGNGNNGHGNNVDGVDSSNPGQGGGGPNGQTDPSGNTDDEGGNGTGGGSSTSGGNNGNSNSGGNGNSGNSNGNNGNGGDKSTNITKPNNTTINSATKSQEQLNTEQYNEHIKKADSYFANKQYDDAYNYYNKALSIKPNESYPKTRLQAIEEIKKEEQTNAAYNDKISKGDLYFKAGKYATAKTFYTQALALKPGATYPTGQINIIDQKLKEQSKPTNNTVKPNTSVVKPNTNVTKPNNTGTGTTGGDKGTGTSSGSSEGTKTTEPVKTVTPALNKGGSTEKPTEKVITPTIGGGR
ncbi:MAG: hypothetical protein H6600_09675 [Flavobacteriales bacterium]|nr:hypothetical protein [Flavobacteriales bacterium]MCB9198719.1 hypothetical protein [Flavobacteriales bacterium]